MGISTIPHILYHKRGPLGGKCTQKSGCMKVTSRPILRHQRFKPSTLLRSEQGHATDFLTQICLPHPTSDRLFAFPSLWDVDKEEAILNCWLLRRWYLIRKTEYSQK